MGNAQGTYFEKIITSNQDFKIGGLEDLFIQNIGSNSVKVGIRTLEPYESLPPIARGTTLENTDLSIHFDTTEGGMNQLYIRAIKVSCICTD